jgi:hypothetical protein
MHFKTAAIAAALLALASTTLSAAPPENAVGEVLAKGFAADKLKRVPRMTFLQDKSGDLIMFEVGGSEGTLSTEFVALNKGGWEGERLKLNLKSGALIKFEMASGAGTADPSPDRILRGELKDGKLHLSMGDKKLAVAAPKTPLLNLGTAMLLLPPYYEFLPKELPFSIFVDKERAVDGFKIVKGAQSGDQQEVQIQSPGGSPIVTVFVSTAAASKGKLLKVMAGGSEVKLLTPEQGRKLMAEREAKAREKAQADKNRTFDIAKIAARFRDHGEVGSKSNEIGTAKVTAGGNVVEDSSYNRVTTKSSDTSLTVEYLEFKSGGKRHELAERVTGSFSNTEGDWSYNVTKGQPQNGLSEIISTEIRDRFNKTSLAWNVASLAPSKALPVGGTWAPSAAAAAKTLGIPAEGLDAGSSSVSGKITGFRGSWVQLEIEIKLVFPQQKMNLELKLSASLPTGKNINGHIEGTANMKGPGNSMVATQRFERSTLK